MGTIVFALLVATAAAGPAPSADQFLADKPADVVGVVRVEGAQSRWVLAEGDHVPIDRVECTMLERFGGDGQWPAGAKGRVAQIGYTDMVQDAIAPPVVAGRRYLLVAALVPAEDRARFGAEWMAHYQGLLLVRDGENGPYVRWGMDRYPLAALRQAAARGPLPLDQIADPPTRVQVAQERLRRKSLGAPDAFVRGLAAAAMDLDQPYAVGYFAVAALRDGVREGVPRDAAARALAEVLGAGPPELRLPAAVALAELDDLAGRPTLRAALDAPDRDLSRDPAGTMSFAGRFPFDRSSRQAASWALARLADSSGLRHDAVAVQLAAAEALVDRPGGELDATLRTILEEQEPKVRALRESGALGAARAPNDFRLRLPEEWVRAHAFLARRGQDESLRVLIEAQIEDAATYPREADPLVPSGHPVQWSSGLPLLQAITGAGQRKDVLRRATALFSTDPRWTEPPLRALRETLAESAAAAQAAPAAADAEPRVRALLAGKTAEERAEGLAAAGYLGLEAFHAEVRRAALEGAGLEHAAALYALTFYDRDLPEADLRALVAKGDAQARLSALDIATRTDPRPFAKETLDVLRAQVKAVAAAPPEQRHLAENALGQVPRIVARFGRTATPPELLAGLADPDPTVRRVLALGLGMSGNPDLVGALRGLAADPDPATRQAVDAAIVALEP